MDVLYRSILLLPREEGMFGRLGVGDGLSGCVLQRDRELEAIWMGAAV